MARKTHSPLLDFLTTRAWALEPSVLQQMHGVVLRHIDGKTISQDALDEIVAARDAKQVAKAVEAEVVDGTAIIPITGVIAKHASQVNHVSQPRGTSTLEVGSMLKKAMADESVHRIMLAIDSPGGAVDGVQALADQIYAVRGKKPIVAMADGQMCSAAYWLGSQADQIMAAPDAVVGSIGVYATTADVSRAAKNEGVEVTVVRNGKHKGAGTPGTQMTDDQKQALQETVDSYAELFQTAVARGRGMDMESVQAIGTGQHWVGQKAVDMGLADGVCTLEDLLGKDAAMPAMPGMRAENTDIAGAIVADVPLQAPVGQGKEHMEPSTTNAATPRPLTTADVVEKHPGVAEALRVEGALAERQRVSAIQGLTATGQEALAADLIAKGASETEALKALHADLKNRKSDGLQAIIKAAPKTVGQEDRVFVEQAQAVTQATPAIAEDDYEGQAKAAFAKEPNLKREFGSADVYAGWLKSNAANKLAKRRAI